MKVNGHLSVLGFLDGAFEQLDAFPENPRIGSWAFIQKRFMLCGEIENGVPVWIPLTNEVDTFVHTQSVEDTTWTIPHKLNFSTPVVQCYDENNKVVNPTSISPVDQDSLEIVFPEAIKGRAIILVGDFSGNPKPSVAFSVQFTDKSTVEVSHGLGYPPTFVIVSGGYELQPKSITHNDDFSMSTITFAAEQSGYIRAI